MKSIISKIVFIGFIFTSINLYSQNKIESSGNVGIGTTTPSVNLEIKSPSNNDSEVHINTTSDNGISILRFQDAGTSTFGFLSNYPHSGKFSLFNYQTYTNAMVVNNSGYFGIGTTEPRYKLELNGDMGFTNNGSKLYFSVNDYIQFTDGTKDGFKFVYDGTEKMRLDNYGNLGIGTTEPRYKLELNGDMGFTNNGSKLYFSVNDYIQFTDGTKDGFKFVYDGIEKMRLDNYGNLGIGTNDTKGFKLAVKGKIGAEEIEVKANYWSDFVFNSDYNLKSLDEVESFIEENNHLPDIPSEKEVKGKGINLGDMDAKLLQKIEELTLYMIDINKRVKSLEEENKTLKKENNILKTQ